MASLKHPFEAKDEKGLAQKVMTGIYRPVADTYSRDMHDAIKVMRACAAKLTTAMSFCSQTTT